MEELRPKCKFKTCYAGGGVAGNGCCFLGGNPQDPDCKQWKDENKELRKQKRRGALSRWHR